MKFRCPPCVFIKIEYNKDGHYKGVAYTNYSNYTKIIPKYSITATLKLQYNSMVVGP